jgi:hypothetical protein
LAAFDRPEGLLHAAYPSSQAELPFLKVVAAPTNGLSRRACDFITFLPFFAWWFFPKNRGAAWII